MSLLCLLSHHHWWIDAPCLQQPWLAFLIIYYFSTLYRNCRQTGSDRSHHWRLTVPSAALLLHSASFLEFLSHRHVNVKKLFLSQPLLHICICTYPRRIGPSGSLFLRSVFQRPEKSLEHWNCYMVFQAASFNIRTLSLSCTDEIFTFPYVFLLQRGCWLR